MGISIRTHKMLWGRSGNRCAMPTCKRVLYEDETLTDDASLVGEEAHIVARNQEGPRGNFTLTTDERDKYDNLVLLCSIHHKVVDDQYLEYTVDKLRKIKNDHLEWVEKNLSPDDDRQKDDEVYAMYIDKWIELAGINEWKGWTSHVFGSGEPQIFVSRYNKLRDLNEYLLARNWPKRYPNLELAFQNFRLILNELLNVFVKYSQKIGEDENALYTTEKVYKKLRKWDEEEYDRLYRIFEYQVDLVQDLAIELTKSANYICAQIRKTVLPSFRMAEGVLLIETGPDMNFSWTTVRLEYPSNDFAEIRYQGLRHLMEDRSNWSYHFGNGISESYFAINYNEE
jgi:hypothetical protein